MPLSSHSFFVELATARPVEITWSTRDQDDVVPVSAPPADGGAISGWTAADGSTFAQATGAAQPLVEIDDMPGLTALKFDGAQNMTTTPPHGFQIGIIAMLVRFDGLGSGESRSLVTRDTTATTTKPAFALKAVVA